MFVMLSFFTVYREGFETVLFYQAILSFAKYMEWYVIAGLISGLAVIIGIVFLIRRLGKKLPLRVLFGLTMGVGAYMSIAFMGNAIRSFQENRVHFDDESYWDCSEVRYKFGRNDWHPSYT